MLENFNALNDITENSKGEIEINGYTKKALINSLIPGFSYFELICKPRLITDQTKINFSMDKIHKIIKDILRCNICLQIYNEPYNIKKCLHKFCKKCIEDYNRKVKKECAICRQVIEHRRVMREDVKIKNFIKCLIANIDEYNKVENKIFELYLPKYCHNKVQNQSTRKFSCENSPNQLIENTNEKFLEKKSNRREKEKENKEEFCKINSNETSAKEKHKEKEKICVKLIKEIAEESITSKLHLYIEDENITLDYLAKYICIKNKFPESFFDQIHFSINDSKKNKISICKSLSIKKIRIEFPFDNDKIILYFKTLKI